MERRGVFSLNDSIYDKNVEIEIQMPELCHWRLKVRILNSKVGLSVVEEYKNGDAGESC